MSRPPRVAGFDYIGAYRYLLTFCTRLRQTAFLDEATVADTHAQFLRTATAEDFAILAYCFMPDHVHLLVEATADRANFKRFVKLSKQRSGAAYALRVGRPLWQEGYYDRVLRKDEDVKRVARYMLENPVRAGLVATPTEYPHLGSDVWSIVELLTAYQ